MANSCFLAAFSEKPCDGRLVKCHLIPKRLLKQVWNDHHHGRQPEPNRKPLEWKSLDKLIWDPRSWVWGCGGPLGNAGHHGMLDHSRTLRIPFAALPPGTIELATELRLDWWLDREYLHDAQEAA